MCVNLLRVIILAIVVGELCAARAHADDLREGFQSPPSSARPRTWWHWMNGNVTKDGIAKDLAWMKEVGLGGLQNFDVNLATPQIVAKRLVYMTPGWKAAFRFAVGLAQEKGLEFAIASSPGWSETGGPWVPPRDGMKKLVWSETLVAGGVAFNGQLASPPTMTGPFQDLQAVDELAALQGGSHREPRSAYGDVAVLAVPVTNGGREELPRVTSGSGQVLDAALLSNGKHDTPVAIDPGAGGAPSVIHLTYRTPRAIRSATLFVVDAVPVFADPALLPVLEAHAGGGWQKVAEFPLATSPTTVSFAPIKAREFRVVFAWNTAARRVGEGEGAPGNALTMLFPTGPSPGPVKVGELRLSGEARIDRYEAKAGFTVVRDYYALGSPDPSARGIDPRQVVNLTSKLKPDGRLDWTPPPGQWRVLRLGWSLTGATNHPAASESTGLEVDKYDGAAVRRYLETYLGLYRDAVGRERMGASGIRAFLTDSIEVGPSNWTPGLIGQFEKLRGYDPRPWLPALTGTLIGSAAQSDAFLYDFRHTLADLIAREHYGTVATVAHEWGLTLYGEALEDGRPVLGDDIAMRSHTDIPMSALWMWNRGQTARPTLIGDMKGASSVAHLYGQKFVAAESMTSTMAAWAFAPSDLRRVIDLEFDEGVNRPVIHTSVHQPVDDKLPGLALATFGQYFNRHETWASMARPWIDYIARNAFLLQQGENVADVAYFYGEEQPITALYALETPKDVPRQYAFDFVNADALSNAMSVEGHELVAKAGARYRVLYLGGTSERMTLPTLRRLSALVEAGATVVGVAPKDSPSLTDAATEFAALVHRLWPGGATAAVGKGRVLATHDVESALADLDVTPDFAFSNANGDGEVFFVHRKLTDGDVYFIDNRSNRPENIEARFRVSGRRPEIWYADTGAAEAVSYRFEGDRTVVPLGLEAEESYFVVFREAVSASEASVAPRSYLPVLDVHGPWQVAFQPGRGAPPTARLETLRSLSEEPEPGIRYFSGIATYRVRFTPPRDLTSETPLVVDLGSVGDIAEVSLNGRAVGTVWKPPYRVAVTAAVRPGENELEVRVADLWVNRLIGDAQPSAAKITYTTLPTYRADAPLRPSGLIGPVRLLRPVQH